MTIAGKTLNTTTEQHYVHEKFKRKKQLISIGISAHTRSKDNIIIIIIITITT